MSEKGSLYSIQRTYIIKSVSNPENRILTCDERIDIPTIEPLSNVKPIALDLGIDMSVIPCIELAGEFLSEFKLTFETNEGVTVLPIEIAPGNRKPFGNPYTHFRYVLVLPRGATGVKSCKLIRKDTGEEVTHNFTFGIMPPPYNYDNMLFGYSQYIESALLGRMTEFERTLSKLKLVSKTAEFPRAQLPKGNGEQSVWIAKEHIYFTTVFSYPPTSEETVHHPVISVKGSNGKHSYTLALNRTSQAVLVDLIMSMITVYDSGTGEIMQQFKLPLTIDGFNRLGFDHFDDIEGSALNIEIKGRPVQWA